MILEENFTIEHIEEIKESRKVDKNILERSIYALGLLEALARVGLPFIFKGGTALLLLLDTPRRLSTEIDIIVKPDTDFEHYLEAASQIIPFKAVEEQERKRAGNIEKRHYKFTYDSPAYGGDFYILLDILFEENHYARTIEKPIANSLIITEEPYFNVTMPTVDCILGDKLTAFAPHTTGIPYGVGKELEIIKQMYDIASLFDASSNFEDVYKSYMDTVNTEIKYRDIDITYEAALMDTIDAAATIVSRGHYGEDYRLLLSGIRAISTHIFDEKFSAEKAVLRGAKTMYAAACILKNVPIRKITDIDAYKDENLSDSVYSSISKIRNFDKLGFAYAVEAIRLLNR